MSKKKEYQNVFAKLAETHNQFVPVLRSLNLKTVKVRNTRILTLRDILEYSEDILLPVDLLTEYLVLNNYILKFISTEQLDSCYDLIKSKNKDNVVIAANVLYNLIEEKKQEIKEKLDERVIQEGQ